MYLGARVEFPSKKEFETIESIGFDPSDGMLIHTENTMCGIDSFKSEYASILLRPLSSMTETEAAELMKSTFLEGGEAMFEMDLFRILPDCVLIESGTFWMRIYYDCTIEVRENWAVDNMLVPYLASKGFDCFNLIGAGIAKPITP